MFPPFHLLDPRTPEGHLMVHPIERIASTAATAAGTGRVRRRITAVRMDFFQELKDLPWARSSRSSIDYASAAG